MSDYPRDMIGYGRHMPNPRGVEIVEPKSGKAKLLSSKIDNIPVKKEQSLEIFVLQSRLLT